MKSSAMRPGRAAAPPDERGAPRRSTPAGDEPGSFECGRDRGASPNLQGRLTIGGSAPPVKRRRAEIIGACSPGYCFVNET
jgi:hypothetical protein